MSPHTSLFDAMSKAKRAEYRVTVDTPFKLSSDIAYDVDGNVAIDVNGSSTDHAPNYKSRSLSYSSGSPTRQTNKGVSDQY